MILEGFKGNYLLYPLIQNYLLLGWDGSSLIWIQPRYFFRRGLSLTRGVRQSFRKLEGIRSPLIPPSK